jgi:hypothetical protein
MHEFTCDLVIAYYKENLEWLKEFENYPFRKIYIYSKGKTPELPFQKDSVEIINLENYGRCDHTYIYHIVHKYHSLADVTIFCTGSVGRLPHKTGSMQFIVPKVFVTKTSVFRVIHEPDYKKKYKGFRVKAWRSSSRNNQENVSKNTAHPSTLPFEEWYEKFFKGINLEHVAYGGVFAVSKQHIHHRKEESYKELLNEFPQHSNPEVGHYFERTWLGIFHPVPPECIYLEKEDNRPLKKHHGGTRKISRRRKLRRRNRSR